VLVSPDTDGPALITTDDLAALLETEALEDSTWEARFEGALFPRFIFENILFELSKTGTGP